MTFDIDRVKLMCEKLESQISRELFSVDGGEYVLCDYKKDNCPPTEGWLPFKNGDRFSGYDGHLWVRANFKTPACDSDHYLVLSCTTGLEERGDSTNPQGLLYLNGKMVQGLDTHHYEAYLEPDTEYEMYDYVYLGMVTTESQLNFKVKSIDKRIEKLFYDLRVPYDVCLVLGENNDDYRKIFPVLERTLNLLDFRVLFSEAYFDSIKKADEYIMSELYEKLCSKEGKPIVNCLGHTHIDVEWQWTRYQTMEKIQRSFSTAKALMDHYPRYKFMLSQPQLYMYLKKEAPEKYEELKELVKQGRWEPEGAMFLEADCNLISGESFIRQIMHGKKFFKDEFGVDNKILFLPDVFGYSAALPQILNKCGIRHFMTSKISWNDTNSMPVDSFMWQGIDGTEIFTNFITAQNHNSTSHYTTYVGMLTPSQIKGSWNKYLQKDYCDRTLTTFGYGDGGGGPTKKMLETEERLKYGLPGMPVTVTEFLLPHLDKVREQFDENCKLSKRTPRWVGELYLEYHRGTYTSIGKNKRGNRKSEYALQKAETLSATDMYFGGEYDSVGLWDNWEKTLHNQFHDIIPGSSIHEVYELTDVDYKEIGDYCRYVTDSKLKSIASKLKTDGGTLVYNPLGFERSGTAVIGGKTCKINSAPAFGWTVVKSLSCDNTININGLTLESKHYIAEFDKVGRISRLYDKDYCREVFTPGKLGNDIQIFEDYPRVYDNWEISDYYKQKQFVLDDNVTIEPVYDGCRAGFKVTRIYFRSTMTQYIWFYEDDRRIDFDNDYDWHEDHQLVKAAFPLNIKTSSATFEIQYGHVTRPTHMNTSWEQAKFEVYGHKWVDMSDYGYGVALLNDCKYGHNIEGDTLKISLLKCSQFPDKMADQGRHIFTYSLLPHSGDFRKAGVIKAAYSLNQPLETLNIGKADGNIPDTFSFISCENDNIILETVKKSENDDGTVLRFYDSFNMVSNAVINIPDKFKKAYICDMLENEETVIPVVMGKVTVPVKNFEIITLKLK